MVVGVVQAPGQRLQMRHGSVQTRQVIRLTWMEGHISVLVYL